MDFELSEQTKQLQTLARDFVRKECLPVEKEMIRREPDWNFLPPEYFNDLRRKAKQIGLWALDVPKEHGGVGLDVLTYCVVLEEQNKTVIGTAHRGPLWTQTSQTVLPALYQASEFQRKKYLAPLVSGEKFAGMAFTEPQSGSDAGNVLTTAVKDGDSWIINGAKTFATLGDAADFLYVTAQADKSKGRNGILLFIVDKNAPGMKVERKINTIRPLYANEISFNNCRIDDRQRVEGPGWDLLQNGFWLFRFYMVARMLGMASRAIDETANYVPQRSTFGEPLSRRQLVQEMLVDSAIEIHTTRLWLMEQASRHDKGEHIPAEQTFMIKVLATEMAYRVLDKCIQCLGGLGLSKDLPLERWYREIRVWRIADGPSEVLRWSSARALFKGWRP